MFLNGKAIPTRGPRGEEIVDDTFLLCFNAHHEAMTFTLPSDSFGIRWYRVVDTSDPDLRRPVDAIAAAGTITLTDRSLVVLQSLSERGTPEAIPAMPSPHA